MNFTEIKDIIISACKKHGIEEYEVYYTVGEDISAETLKQEVSAFSSGESAKVYFRCLVNGHMGYASSSYFDADELEDLVVRASENAKVIENDDVVVIFKGSESYAKTTAPEPADIEAAELKRCALELQKATYSVSDAVVDGTQSIAMSFKNEMYLYNSHGLELSNRVGMSGCYVVSVVNKDGEARDNFEFAENIYSEDAKKLPEKAVQARLTRSVLPRYPRASITSLSTERRCARFCLPFRLLSRRRMHFLECPDLQEKRERRSPQILLLSPTIL